MEPTTEASAVGKAPFSCAPPSNEASLDGVTQSPQLQQCDSFSNQMKSLKQGFPQNVNQEDSTKVPSSDHVTTIHIGNLPSLQTEKLATTYVSLQNVSTDKTTEHSPTVSPTVNRSSPCDPVNHTPSNDHVPQQPTNNSKPTLNEKSKTKMPAPIPTIHDENPVYASMRTLQEVDGNMYSQGPYVNPPGHFSAFQGPISYAPSEYYNYPNGHVQQLSAFTEVSNGQYYNCSRMPGVTPNGPYSYSHPNSNAYSYPIQTPAGQYAQGSEPDPTQDAQDDMSLLYLLGDPSPGESDDWNYASQSRLQESGMVNSDQMYVMDDATYSSTSLDIPIPPVARKMCRATESFLYQLHSEDIPVCIDKVKNPAFLSPEEDEREDEPNERNLYNDLLIEENNKYRCALCKIIYIHKKSANRHLRTVHDGLFVPQGYKCRFCDNIYNHKGTRNKHQKAAHGHLMKSTRKPPAKGKSHAIKPNLDIPDVRDPEDHPEGSITESTDAGKIPETKSGLDMNITGGMEKTAIAEPNTHEEPYRKQVSPTKANINATNRTKAEQSQKQLASPTKPNARATNRARAAKKSAIQHARNVNRGANLKDLTCSECGNVYSRRDTVTRHLRLKHNIILQKGASGSGNSTDTQAGEKSRSNDKETDPANDDLVPDANITHQEQESPKEKPGDGKKNSTDLDEANSGRKNNVCTDVEVAKDKNQENNESEPQQDGCSKGHATETTDMSDGENQRARSARQRTVPISLETRKDEELKKIRRTCLICGKVLCHSWNLNRHLLLHSPSEVREKYMECFVCHQRYADLKMYMKHMKKHKLNGEVLEKDGTFFKVKQTSAKDYMKVVKHNPVPVLKPKPIKVLPQSITVDLPPKVSEPEPPSSSGESDVRPYQCHICSTRFVRSYGLRRHLHNVHHRKGDKVRDFIQLSQKACFKMCDTFDGVKKMFVYSCPSCNMGFIYHESLVSHVNREHSSENITIPPKKTNDGEAGSVTTGNDNTFPERCSRVLRSSRSKDCADSEAAQPTPVAQIESNINNISKLPVQLSKSSPVFDPSENQQVSEPCHKDKPDMNNNIPKQTGPKDDQKQTCDAGPTTVDSDKPDNGVLVQTSPTGMKVSQIKPLPCAMCDAVFTSSNTLLAHEEMHVKHKTVMCKQCGQEYPSIVELKEHASSTCAAAKFPNINLEQLSPSKGKQWKFWMVQFKNADKFSYVDATEGQKDLPNGPREVVPQLPEPYSYHLSGVKLWKKKYAQRLAQKKRLGLLQAKAKKKGILQKFKNINTKKTPVPLDPEPIGKADAEKSKESEGENYSFATQTKKNVGAGTKVNKKEAKGHSRREPMALTPAASPRVTRSKVKVLPSHQTLNVQVVLSQIRKEDMGKILSRERHSIEECSSVVTKRVTRQMTCQNNSTDTFRKEGITVEKVQGDVESGTPNSDNNKDLALRSSKKIQEKKETVVGKWNTVQKSEKHSFAISGRIAQKKNSKPIKKDLIERCLIETPVQSKFMRKEKSNGEVRRRLRYSPMNF